MIEKKLAEMMAAMYKSERVFTLAESRKRVEYQGKFVEFDSGSLYVYKHNLDRFQWATLGGELRNLVVINKEERKERLERIILINYLLATNRYRDFVIEKTVRPDFLLRKGDVCIGVEITELTNQTFKVLDRINCKYSNVRISCDEVKRLAIEEHGEKAKGYNYYECCSTVRVGSDAFRVNDSRRLLSTIIDAKLRKYEGMAKELTKMIVVCATPGIEITEKWEIDSVFDAVWYEPINPIEVAILLDGTAYSREYGTV